MSAQLRQISLFPEDSLIKAESRSYLAVCKGCGAINWVAVDEPHLAKEIGKSMRDSVQRGDLIMHLTTERIREELQQRSFKCICDNTSDG